MNRRRTRLALIAVGVAALLAGCAQSGYDQAQLQRKLVHAGLTQKQAQCITDGFDNSFKPEVLAAYADPNVQQEQTTTAVLKKCGVTPVSSPTH